MHRWVFGGEELATHKTEPYDRPVGNNGQLIHHTFRVLVNQRLEPGERVAVTGECACLGRWMPADCVQLDRETGGEFVQVN